MRQGGFCGTSFTKREPKRGFVSVTQFSLKSAVLHCPIGPSENRPHAMPAVASKMARTTCAGTLTFVKLLNLQRDSELVVVIGWPSFGL